jgi:hypothetical protein
MKSATPNQVSRPRIKISTSKKMLSPSKIINSPSNGIIIGNTRHENLRPILKKDSSERLDQWQGDNTLETNNQSFKPHITNPSTQQTLSPLDPERI